MFRLFRSTRQNLLNENKTVKYLKYAVGEFILVVLGILVALQISNWNQIRKEHLEEVVILNRIVNELDRCISDVNLWSEGVLEKEQAIHNLISAFSGQPVSDPLAFLRDLPKSADMGWTQPALPQSTYNELVGSGKLGLITNIQLRENINDYYEELVEWHKRGDAHVNEDYTKIVYILSRVKFCDSQRTGI